MAKLILTAVALIALVGGLKADIQPAPPTSNSYGLNAPANYAQNLPSQMQNQFSQGQQQAGGLLSGLLGGSGSSSSGPFETLRQLPARGLQMLNNVFSGVRNMLPVGLGRNANIQDQNNMSNPLGQLSPDQLIRNLPKNPVTDMAQGLLGQNPNSNYSGNNGQQGAQNNLLGQLSPDQLLQNLPKNPVTDMAQGLLGQNTNGNGGDAQGLRLPNLNLFNNNNQNAVPADTQGAPPSYQGYNNIPQ